VVSITLLYILQVITVSSSNRIKNIKNILLKNSLLIYSLKVYSKSNSIITITVLQVITGNYSK